VADKETKLSIVLRTVDKATAKIKAINDRLDAATKPIRNLKDALSDLKEKSGLTDVASGFRGVGSAASDLFGKLLIGVGVIGAATAGVFKLVDGFDELGDKAEAIGVSVDFLASMRYAAERSGAAVDQLDGGLKNFSKSLGQARAGTGRMASFLNKVSPALLVQLKAAKSNEAAFDLLAGAMAKLEDPAKRAALAQATLGDAELAPLFAKGPKAIKELRERYLQFAGSQEEAAAAAGEVDDSMKDLKASTDGIKAALVSGLGPALKIIVDRLREWFTEHRTDIREWATQLGQRLPGAVSSFVSGIRSAIDAIRPFVDSGTKLKVIAVGLAAVLAGPLLSAIATLGVALLTNPIGLIVTGIATAALLIIKYWGPIKEFFVGLWDGVKAAFSAAWDFIAGIVDKVVNAVDKVISAAGRLGGVGAIRDIIEDANPTAVVPNLGAQAMSAAGVNRTFSSSEARVKVDFANMPRGARVKTDPQSSADVDLSVGYQMLGGGL
jgi:phage-related minor tail protein